MNRPYVFVGICSLAASFLVLYAGFFEAALVLMGSAVISVLWVIRKKKKLTGRIFIATMLLLIAIRMGISYSELQGQYKELKGTAVQVKGYVQKTLYEGENSTTLAIRIEESKNPKAKGVLASVTFVGGEALIPGDRIEAEIQFLAQEKRERRFLLGSGYGMSGFAEDFRKIEGKSLTPWRTVHYIRQTIGDIIDSNVSGEEAAVLKALIIGDPSDISPEFYSCVKNTGISHLLVVSGMHLGLLCGIVFALLQRWSNRPLHVVLGVATVLFIAIICLLQASILRASLAYIIMLISKFFLKNYDSINSLCLGITLTLLINPFIFYNAAFMLSITATFSVIYPATMLTRGVSFYGLGKIWSKVTEYVYGVLATAFSALVCTLPVVVYYFEYAPLLSPVVNLLVEMAMNGGLVIGVVALLVWYIPFVGQALALPFFEIARIFVAYFIAVTKAFGEVGAGVLELNGNTHFMCFFIAVLFVVLVKIWYDKKRKKKEKYRFAKRKDVKIIY